MFVRTPSEHGIIGDLRICAIFFLHNLLVLSLRQCNLPGRFNQHCNLNLCHRHNRFFHVLYAHGCILIICCAFLYPTINSSQNTECHTNHSFCFRKNLKNLILPRKSFCRCKSNDISTVCLCNFDNSFSQTIHPYSSPTMCR